MAKGFVKWWGSEKGYGFLSMGDGKDVFCHYSAIKMTGRRDLKEGDQVEFDVEPSDKGLRAKNVTIVGSQEVQ